MTVIASILSADRLLLQVCRCGRLKGESIAPWCRQYFWIGPRDERHLHFCAPKNACTAQSPWALREAYLEGARDRPRRGIDPQDELLANISGLRMRLGKHC